MSKIKKPKAEYRKTLIQVKGRGEFPADMLRFDNCSPATSTDAGKMERSTNERIVMLYRFSSEASKATADRWKSFGWQVVSDEGIDS